MVLLILFALVASFGLSWLYAVVLYWADRHEKEPKKWLLGMFLWGAVVAVFGTLVFSLALDAGVAFVLGMPGGVPDLVNTVLVAPFVEETMKGAALLVLLLLARHEFDSLFDGIIYGALVGLGFEATENFFYLVGAAEQGLGFFTLVTFIRLGLFGFTHAFFTGLTGLGVAAWRMYGRRHWWAWMLPVIGWSAAVVAHMVHNASVSFGAPACFLAVLSDWSGLLALAAIVAWALRRERQWLKTSLREEVEAGRITPTHYRAMLSPWQKRILLGQARRLGRGREARTLLQKLADLAFLKAHLARSGPSAGHLARLQRLQQEVADLARRLKGL